MTNLKSICLFIIVSLSLISIKSFSQNLEIIKDELPVYQGIVKVLGKDSKQIFGLLKEWVVKNYKSTKDVIQFEDVENGKLVLKGIDRYIIEAAMGIKVENILYHTITLETKLQKFRYTIEVTEVTTGTSYQPILQDILLTNPPIKFNGKEFSGGMLKGVLKQKSQHLEHINSVKNSLISSFSNISFTKKDEW